MHDTEHLLPFFPVALIAGIAIGFAVVNALIARYAGVLVAILSDVVDSISRREGETKFRWERLKKTLARKPDPVHDMAYESGMEPFHEANLRVPIKFYMIAIIFLLFDVEAVFLLGWAVTFNGTDPSLAAAGISAAAFRAYAFVSMFVFLAVLELGHVYVWRKGGLEWS